jgi:hypothetical protein
MTKQFLLVLFILLAVFGQTSNAERSMSGPFADQPVRSRNRNDANANKGEIQVDEARRGANPYVDVLNYGVRALTYNSAPAIPGITANCTARSPRVAISSASTFQNGDGVDLIGCGPSNSMSTPSAPTGKPSLAAAPPGTGYVVSAPSSTTQTVFYKIVARDAGQGLTAASPEITVTGPSLGPKTLSVSSSGIASNNIITVTTAARSPEVLAVGAEVCINGTSNDFQYGGCQIITSIPSDSSFTYTTNQDTRAGSSKVASTGGTLTYWPCNHLVLPTPCTGVFQYGIYKGTSSGGETLIGVSMVADSALSPDPSYMTWDDFGSPYTTLPNLPYFWPGTPPRAAVPDTLVTTISSGAGTTTLTVLNAPNNSQTGATALFDNAPNFATAYAAAQMAQGMVYIPASAFNTFYVTNSYLDLHSYAGTGTSVVGQIYLNDTMNVHNLHGDLTPAYLATPSFAITSLTSIYDGRANPGILTTGGNFSGLVLSVGGNCYNGFFVESDGGIPVLTFENMAIISASSADYCGVDYTQFTVYTAGESGSGVYIHKAQFSAQEQGQTPLFISKNVGEVNLIGPIMTNGRGFFFSASNTGTGILFDQQYESEGSIMPVVTLGGVSGAGTIGISLKHTVLDTVGWPAVTNVSNSQAYVSMESAGIPQAGMAVISGKPFTGVNGLSPLSAITTTNTTGGIGGLIYDGTFNNNQEITWNNQSILLGPNYSFFTAPTQPAAPVCTTISGGPPYPAAGSYAFNYYPVYANGGWGVLSATSNSCAVNGTSQQIHVTISPAVSGAVNYVWYVAPANNGNLAKMRPGCGSVYISTTVTYEGGNCGGFSLPSAPGGGPAGIVNGNMWAQDFILGATPAPTGVANATKLYMDSTALWPSFKPNGNKAYVIPGISGPVINGHNLCADGTTGAYRDCLTTPTIASGTATLRTSPITARNCAAVVTIPAAGVVTTDAVSYSFNAAPSGAYTNGLFIQSYVTPGNVNFLVCNLTTENLTPPGATLNWRVTR